MIETVPLDIPTGFFLGALLPLFAARRIRTLNPRPAGGAVPLATAAAAWFGLTVQPALWAYPDWMWAYMLDSSRIPSIYPGVFWCAVTGAGVIGAIVSQAFIARDQLVGALLTIGFGGAMWLAVFILTGNQYGRVGTFLQYHAQQAVPLSEHAGLLGLMKSIAIADVLGLIAISWLLVRSDRRLTP